MPKKRNEKIWVNVYGFPKYEVNQYGEIRHKKIKKILKPFIRPCGYCYVGLRNECRQIHKRVHVIVMMSFRPIEKKRGFDKNYVINHIDGNKTNNRLDNLEWCTAKDNMQHALKMGLMTNEHRKVKVICLDNNKIFESVKDASAFAGGKGSGHIGEVCKGKRSQYRNYHFAYYDDFVNKTIPKFMGSYKRRSFID